MYVQYLNTLLCPANFSLPLQMSSLKRHFNGRKNLNQPVVGKISTKFREDFFFWSSQFFCAKSALYSAKSVSRRRFLIPSIPSILLAFPKQWVWLRACLNLGLELVYRKPKF